MSKVKESQQKSGFICPLSVCGDQGEETGQPHSYHPPNRPPTPSTPLQVPLTMPISIHLSFSQEAAVRGLALDGGRKWTVTDSSRLERERETNELWGESWGFASEKIRMAFGSGTKMLGCIRHTVIATLALCFFPSLPTERPDCTRERHLMSLWFSSLTSTFT